VKARAAAPQDGRPNADGIRRVAATDGASELDDDLSDVADVPRTSDEALCLAARFALKEGDHKRLQAVLDLLCRGRRNGRDQLGAA
jgi:hypothetical protein